MENADNIKRRVDELTSLTLQATIINGKIDEHKAFFERLATENLQDTKTKTIDYWGNNNARVTVSNSQTVKPVSMTMVKSLFGDIFSDFVKEETTYKMSAPCKRLFALTSMGEYTQGKLDDLIRQITSDSQMQNTLKKKLKGKYEKDIVTLMTVAGIDKKQASDWAYLAAEVINWEWLVQILNAAKWSGEVSEAIDVIKAAIIVDEGIKVTVAAED